MGRLRPTHLCESEGLVRSISWGENFIAWSSDIGVRVYDLNARCSLGLIKWEDNSGYTLFNEYVIVFLNKLLTEYQQKNLDVT